MVRSGLGIVAMPESTDNTKGEENTTRARERETILLFWLSVFGGTIVAGGVFGSLFACWEFGSTDVLFGSLLGVTMAAMFGVFTIANVAVVAWCFWLSRFRTAMGGLAGGLTGIAATLPLAFDVSSTTASSWKATALAGVLGTLGGGLAGLWYHSRSRAKGLHRGSPQHHWRFTLRDLFIRVTVFSALLAADVFLINLILTDQP